MPTLSEASRQRRQRQADEAKLVWAEIRRQELRIRERTERLKALRIAKEALEQSVNRVEPLTRIGLDQPLPGGKKSRTAQAA